MLVLGGGMAGLRLEETKAMKTFLQLLVVAALGYAFWVYGLPWVQRTVGQSRAPVSNPAPGPGGTCVQSAALASESLYDRMLESGRSLEEDAEWSRIAGIVDSELFQARGACGCKLQSCAASREALSALTAVFEAVRSQVSASQSMPFDQGRRYEQANQRLWEAYDLAKDGK
jgi:hypothetical protein